MTSTLPSLPPRLEAVRARFETWRSTRTGADRIPESLWKAAVGCAGRFGLYPTVRALGLDYNSLKRRVAAQAARTEHSSPAFIEVLPAGGIAPAECVLEVESRRGAKLRIHLRGGAVPDLALLLRSFAGEEG